MNYYTKIKDKLIDNEIYSRVKDYSKEKRMLLTYYEVGKLLSEAGKHYGKNIIEEYSKRLEIDIGKRYSYRTLNYMIRFYNLNNLQSLTANLSWGNWIELLSIKDIDKIKYYIKQCELLSLTTRQLRERIKNKEYERLPEETKNKLINKEESKVEDFIKDPIIIKNPNNYEIISEKSLKMLILEDIESFMKELGNSYSFIGSEYKIKIGNSYNYIDLLLFNIDFNCYVVVELKVTELRKEYVGQIKLYMNYIDKVLRKPFQDKTIGIIICKKDNKFIMEFFGDRDILSKEYKII